MTKCKQTEPDRYFLKSNLKRAYVLSFLGTFSNGITTASAQIIDCYYFLATICCRAILKVSYHPPLFLFEHHGFRLYYWCTARGL